MENLYPDTRLLTEESSLNCSNSSNPKNQKNPKKPKHGVERVCHEKKIVKSKNIDCRPGDFSDIINKTRKNARSGHITLWSVKLNCLLQIFTFGWTVRRFVILGEDKQ